jgi:hypothetical protein
MRDKRIAVAVGSRGIADLKDIVRAVSAWLHAQGAHPFLFPAMGSHGGGTAEGQRKVLEDYGVTAEHTGAEVVAQMETVSVGRTPEGFDVLLDRAASEADAVLVINRVKPHTDFFGGVESGLLKMMAVGMGKVAGAQQTHRAVARHGYEKVIRAVAERMLASGRILAGLAVVENEFQEIVVVEGAPPEQMVARDEECLRLARRLVPRLPFREVDLLIVDELGKNVSGTGMDTKVIGRGVDLLDQLRGSSAYGETPNVKLIYVRDLTRETDGNAVGVGWADLIHERLYRKIDMHKLYLNSCTALRPLAARIPVHFASDREAIHFATETLGTPPAAEQKFAWIQNTLNLNRIAASQSLADEARALSEWRVSPQPFALEFSATTGDLENVLSAAAVY